MSSVSWTRVNELFLEAVALSAVEHAAFLEESCAGDDELRAEVQRLLAGDVGSANAPFLDPLTTQSLCDVTGALANGSAKTDTFLNQHVGPYEIDSLIGVGGMGRVYRANRREGFSQQVAIKLLKRGMDSDELLRRFHNEIQILAELGKHPNIAALMDAGLTDGQQPYLVMEYVAGERIDKYCDRHELALSERLQLFLGICDAVQYAHQRTVIHRDLKPSNVIVTADGQPKLIDFGIAKLSGTGGEIHHATETRTAMRVYTPNYASPEQADGGQLTTASDVYSLGVLLYELLTGRRPYEIAANSGSAAQAIVAAQPPRASSALASDSNPPHQLKSSDLVGDLDNIIQMAMRKEPERRYATVAEFAEDIRRHLTQFPVVARPETLAYHFGRFLRRHRFATAAATLALVSLTVGILGTTWQWIRAEHEASAALAAIQRAEQAAEQARQHQRAAMWQVYRANTALAAADLERNSLTAARRHLDECSSEMRNWEWRYLDREVRGRQIALLGHSKPVNSVVFYRDGLRMLTSSADGTLRTWNVTTGQQLSLYRDKRGPVEVKACRGGGRLVALVAESSATSIAIWDIEDGHVVAEIPVDATAVDVGGSGSLVATVSKDDQLVRLWNSQDGSLVATLPEPSDSKHIALSRDGNRLAYSQDSAVVLWDVARSKQIALLNRHTSPITALSFSGNSARLITACHYRNAERHYQSELSVWEASNGRKIVDVNEMHDELWSAQLNHAGNRIAIKSSGSILYLRDGTTGEVIQVMAGHQNYITHSEFSPDDQLFASSAADYTVRLWDGQTGDLLTTYTGPTLVVSDVRFGTESRQLAICAVDGSLRVRNLNPSERSVLRGHDDYVYSARWLAGGKQVVSGSWDGSVRIWDVETRTELAKIDVEREVPMPANFTHQHPERILCVSANADGSRIAADVGDGTIQTWQLEKAGAVVPGTRRVCPTKRGENWRSAIAFAPDSNCIAFQAINNEIRLWNVNDNSLQTVCKPNTDQLQCIAFAPGLESDDAASGTTIALGFPSQVQIWALGAERASAILPHREPVCALAYSSDGRYLASGGDGRTIYIWDVAAASSIAELPASSRIYALAFSRDGTRLATGSADQEIQIWDTATWSVVAQLAGHEKYIHSLEFSPDGSQLLSGSGDGTIRIWDAGPAN